MSAVRTLSYKFAASPNYFYKLLEADGSIPAGGSIHSSKDRMSIQKPSRGNKKMPPPGETGQEALYLRFLSEKQIPVTVGLRDGENVSGWIEYFDDAMIRLTRDGKPNLFIYKRQIRTIREHTRVGCGRPRMSGREGSR
jgi:host factor-I protein